MSQDASTHTRLLMPSDASSFASEPSDATESGSFPVESYADRLMDDLFGDVERLLDSNAKLTTEPLRPEPPAPSPQGAALTSFVDLVSPLMRRADSDLEPLTLDEHADALLVPDTERSFAQKPASDMGGSGRLYDRLLLGVGCLSIMATLAVWLINQQAYRQLAPVAVTPQLPASNTIPDAAINNQANNQFVTYLQQALKAIDQQQPGASPVGSNGTPTNLPLVPPGNPTIQSPTTGATTPSPATRTATGLSRLYVPVYQVPQGQAGSPSVAPLPSTSAPATVRPPLPLSMPGIPKKLVGVLELGDRSAALIEINGVTQRYRIGESIATSGWSLVEVSKDQAVLRRNGEVRSIFIGQNF